MSLHHELHLNVCGEQRQHIRCERLGLVHRRRMNKRITIRPPAGVVDSMYEGALMVRPPRLEHRQLLQIEEMFSLVYHSATDYVLGFSSQTATHYHMVPTQLQAKRCTSSTVRFKPLVNAIKKHIRCDSSCDPRGRAVFQPRNHL